MKKSVTVSASGGLSAWIVGHASVLAIWVPIALALSAVIISVIAIVRQTDQSKKSRQLSALQEFGKESRTDAFVDKMTLVFGHNFNSLDEYKQAEAHWNPAEKGERERAMLYAMNFFNDMGLYVELGILDKKAAIAAYGPQIINAWDHLKFHLAQSKAPKDAPPNHFKRLAKLAETLKHKPYKQFQREELLKKLKRATSPGATDEDKTF